jgi:HAMP domain-containing protein
VSTAGWRVPINVKLLVILAIPVLGYVAIASTAVAQAQRTADRAHDEASVVKTAVGPTSLTTSLIDERTITSLESAGLEDDLTLRIGNSTEARRATDEQLTALQALVADNRQAREAYGPAVADVANNIAALRAGADAGQADDAAVFERYSEFIRNLMDANATAVERVDNAEFRQGAMLSELATRQKDTRALLINTLLQISFNENRTIDQSQTVELVRTLSVYENRDAAIQELATGPYANAGAVLVEALEAADLAQLADTTLDTGTVDPNELFELASYKGGFLYQVPTGDFIHDNFRASVVEILDENAGDRTDSAAWGLRLHLVAGSVGLVITAGIAWLVARSITRPLRSLTEQVIETARYRLPETVRDIQETPLGEDVTWPQMEPTAVDASDEIADVAEALNTMQQSALDLAVEEALLRRLVTDSFVTLGQRNQSLLDRQLAFITDLERDETDPDTLADLFHLDHLAVRMRRNAESLLVLAGIDPPRTWVGPTPVAVVIRAALGEAQEYKRVRVQEVEPATITGTATAELSHLLAELIENSLRFSPHGDPVDVSGGHRPAGDGYTMTIQDAGVGMSEQDIDRANRRLAGAESYTMAPSKYMGHYVAGKLAARHGIVVRLRSNAPDSGVTATIDLPAELLTTEAPIETEAQVPPLLADVPSSAEDPNLDSSDLSAPIPLPTGGRSGQKTGGSGSARKPWKGKRRPIAASKLPVPPPTTPLAIQPLDEPSDQPDSAEPGQAS